MNSLADLTSRPVPLVVEVRDDDGNPTGETLRYMVHPLNFADQGELQRWIDTQFPDPYASAWEAIQRQREKGQPFNVAQEQFILKQASELAMRPRHLIGTPEADQLLLSAEGLKRVIVAGIRKGDPAFDDERADRLVKHMTQADIARAFTASQVNLMVSDPKAGAARREAEIEAEWYFDLPPDPSGGEGGADFWSIFHALTSGMSPWTFRDIAELTPLQLLCLSHEKPPGKGTVRSMEELEMAARDEPAWDEGAAHMNLATAIVQIAVNRQALTAGLDQAHRQLLGFVPQAQMLGGRIGGSLIGGFGQALIARKAESMLGPSRANVASGERQVAIERGRLADARMQVAMAQDSLRNATTQLGRTAARSWLRTAQSDVLMARQNLGTAQQGLDAARTAAQGAQANFAATATSIGNMSLMAAAGVGAVLGLAGALVSLAGGLANVTRAGAGLTSAEHNVEQVFGSYTAEIEAAAERQARAFGQSKSEYLAYAADVGRSLEKLGIDEDVAAASTTGLLDAVQRLAQSRRISFGEAFEEATRKGSLFTEQQVRGWAFEKGYLTNRNMLLNAGSEALYRNMMAMERIGETTEQNAVAGDNWNAQIAALQGTFSNLVELIGQELEPAFVSFLKTVNEWLQGVRDNWSAWKEDISTVLQMITNPAGFAAEQAAKFFGGGEEEIGGIRPIEADDAGAGDWGEDEKAAIDRRNKEAAKKAGKRQAVGEVFGGGGGGGAAGVAGGGLVEFAKHIQQAAMSQRLVGIQQQQLQNAQETVRLLRAIHAALGPAGQSGRIAMGAGGGALGGIMAAFE